MTKKDYVAIADALAPAYRQAEEAAQQTDTGGLGELIARADGRFAGLSEAVETLANVFANDNGKFNRSRWFNYLRGECGPNGGAIKKS